MGKPTEEHTKIMAHAVLDAAFKKAEELGYPGYEGIRGITRAHEAVGKFAVLSLILGPSGMDKLGEAIEAEMAQDAVKQAEDILKGEM